MEYNEYLSNLLRDLAEESGLTSEEIVDDLGVSPSTWRRWIRGKAIPNDRNMLRLAGLFNVSYNELTGMEEDDNIVHIDFEEDDVEKYIGDTEPLSEDERESIINAVGNLLGITDEAVRLLIRLKDVQEFETLISEVIENMVYTLADAADMLIEQKEKFLAPIGEMLDLLS